MKNLIFKHAIIQLALLLIYFANEAVVSLINFLLQAIGINPSDTHLSLGVYIFAVLSILLPVIYLVITEYMDKERIAKHFNLWLFRFEVIFLTAVGITIFIS
jgi:hypothetical protein